MKIRLGFVSNSSSTSFCIYGIAIDNSEFLDILGASEKDVEDDNVDVWELMEKNGLSGYFDGDDVVYIGNPIDDMKLDETKQAFQDRVEAEICEKLNHKYNKKHFRWIEETVES